MIIAICIMMGMVAAVMAFLIWLLTRPRPRPPKYIEIVPDYRGDKK